VQGNSTNGGEPISHLWVQICVKEQLGEEMTDVVLRELREDDIDAVNQLHNSNYGTQRTNRQFRWEFLEGPYGPAIFVVAETQGRIVGTHALLPVPLCRRGELFEGVKDEATLVASDFRGRGIAARLFAETSRLGSERGFRFSFGLSNSQANLRGKVRDGHTILGKVAIGLRVLNARATKNHYVAWLNSHVPASLRPLAHTTVEPLLDMASRWGTMRHWASHFHPCNDLRVQVTQEVDNTLNEFCRRLCASSNSFSIARMPVYLHWHAFANPYVTSYLIQVLHGGDIVGYALMSFGNDTGIGTLTDLCALPEWEPEAYKLALHEAIDIARERGTPCIGAWTGGRRNPEGARCYHALRAAGFVFAGFGVWCHGKPLAPHSTSTAASLLHGYDSLDNWYVTLLFSQGVM